MIKVYPKGSQEKVGRHFRACEFDCPCSYDDCKETRIDSELVDLLDNFRDQCGCPLLITSGCRCHRHQQDLREQGYPAAKDSEHEKGEAADVKTGKQAGLELEELARKVGFRAVGVADHWVHVDTRMDRDRSWSY